MEIEFAYLTNNSRKTTFEQQPTNTPRIANIAFVFMIQLVYFSSQNDLEDNSQTRILLTKRFNCTNFALDLNRRRHLTKDSLEVNSTRYQERYRFSIDLISVRSTHRSVAR